MADSYLFRDFDEAEALETVVANLAGRQLDSPASYFCA